MTTDDTPPAKPRITVADRQAFKTRVKKALSAAGLSQRQTEHAIGMARGTISKVFSGKIALTLKVLREVADQANVAPETLVQGTGLQHLLLEAPETPASKELANALAQVATLRAELAARNATIAEFERQHATRAAETEELRRQLADVVQKNDALTQSLENERSSRAAHEASEKTSRALVRSNQVARDATERQIAELSAKLQETKKQLDAWRTYALARNQRVQQLESELSKQFARAQQQPNEAGRLLLAAIAGFGLGTYSANA